jgi:hypothetical protein
MDVASKRLTPFNLISDDMYFNDNRKAADNGDTYQKYKNGEYTEGDKQSWGSCYQGIRNASIYIHNIDKCAELTPQEITDKKAQARFLRAYYYWLLLRKYGPIPILPDEGLDFTEEYDALAIPRSAYDACAEYIGSELALAAQDLSIERDNRNIARPTKGAALAARAKMFLFAASPLFNGNTDAWATQLVDHEGNRLTSATYDESKWARAAAAAKEVMNMGVYDLYTVPVRENEAMNVRPDFSHVDFDYYRAPKTIVPPYHSNHSGYDWPRGWRNIDPFESYRQIFNGQVPAFNNPELIFTRGRNQGGEGVNALYIHQFPYSLGGWNTHGLTLKMYDAYYTNSGEEFNRNDEWRKGYTTNTPSDSASSYHNYLPLPPRVSLQHANREPRFYASVAYNGSIWDCEFNMVIEILRGNTFKQVFYYRDSPDGKLPGESQFYLPTGIGIKKYVHPFDAGVSVSAYYNKTEPAIRYAEVLLIYAEALNELTGAHAIPSYDGTASIAVSRDVSEMSKAMSRVRIRAGLPDFTQDVYADQTLFRAKLKRERQIELMGEGHRYFDLRRWKDAPREEGTPVWGFNMNMPSSQRELFDTPLELLSFPSVFVDKMYLWPISHGELRRNRNLTQNPGWTYFTE